MVADHQGQESKIWSRFEDEGAQVEGARLAEVVDAVIASGEAVTVKTRDTKWGRDLVAVRREPEPRASVDDPDSADGEGLDAPEELEEFDDDDLPF